MTVHEVASGSSRYRVEPAPLVGVAMIVAYIVVVFGIQLSSGIPYVDWLSTPTNGLRTAVLPLAVGTVLLVGFLAIPMTTGVALAIRA